MKKPILKNEIVATITSVGAVEDNILEAKEYALSLKEYYSHLIFSEEQIAEAKEERASINKIVKKIGDYRKNIVAEFKKPIELFEQTAKETEKILKETSDFVDIQVKNFESKEKEERKEKARIIYEENIEELKDVLPFEKVFNDKWLNKGNWKEDGTSKVVLDEINNIKGKVRNGFKAIEELKSEFELELKNTFLVDYDISKAIFKNTQLLEQKKAFSKVEEKKEEITQEKIEALLKEEVKTDDIDPIKEYTLKIKAPLSKQKELKRFLDLNNMEYELIK
jgi:hypothetical protein